MAVKRQKSCSNFEQVAFLQAGPNVIRREEAKETEDFRLATFVAEAKLASTTHYPLHVASHPLS